MSFKLILLVCFILFSSCGVKSPPRSIQDDSIQNYISSHTDQYSGEKEQEETDKKKK